MKGCKLILIAFCGLSYISSGQVTAKLQDGTKVVLSPDKTWKFEGEDNKLNDQSLWKLKRYEVVLGAGPAFFYGDIGEFENSIKDNILGLEDRLLLQPSYNVNLNLKYRISQKFYGRLSFTGGKLQASDEMGPYRMRGYESSISIFEPALVGEFHFSKNSTYDYSLLMNSKDSCSKGILKYLDLYLFTGIGGLFYSVKANDFLTANMAQISIIPKNRFTAVLPIGFGINFRCSPSVNFGIETGGKFPFTDYLDGYTNIFSTSNDKYFFFNFTIAYKIKIKPRIKVPKIESLPPIGSV